MAEFSSITVIRKELQELTLAGVKRVDKQKILGNGSYGRVFSVKQGGKIYAAKQIHSILVESVSEKERQTVRDNFLKECYRCKDLNHPNIVRFIGVYYPDRNSTLPVMVMELMDTSLTEYVKTPNITMKLKISILHDISQGLSYLHCRDLPIIHRDLSPNNILLSRDLIAKISDLGVAKAVKADTKSTNTKAPGTIDFMPPEALLTDHPRYSTSLDVFSYGGLILHVVNQEWPTPSSRNEYDSKMNPIKTLTEIERRQKYLDMLMEGAEVLKLLVVCCLDNDPEKRPTAAGILEVLKALKERRGQGSFKEYEAFKCHKDCAVFMAMHKLTDVSTVEAAKVTPTSNSSELTKYRDGVPIRLGDYVVFYNKFNLKQRGIVRWLGTNKTIRPDGTPIVGIEAETSHLNLNDIPHNISDRFIRDYFPSRKSKVFLPVSFVHRDKTYNPVVDQEKPAENNFLGALPNPPRGTKTKSERDTKPQCVTNEDEEHEYESIDLIVPESCNPYNLGVGSAVQYLSFSKYGVIKWIGSISCNKEILAGLEMEDENSGAGNNGELCGVKYFQCKPGKGKFALLSSLRPDKRNKKIPDKTKAKYNDKPSKKAKFIPQIFDGGCIVQFGDPVQYGEIKGLQNEYAAVEMESFEHKVTPPAEIQLDSRFLFDVNKKQEKNPLESMLYIHDEDSLVPPDETFENDKHACIKGIQGCKNSCYLDATIYGMFTFSNAFDIVFLDEIKTDNEICYAQRMLKNKIVYPLRVKGVVLQDSIQAFRTYLAELQNMKGLTSEEKDPEEFINLLFKHIIHLEPFVTIRRPSGIDKEFLIQLFVEPDANVTTVTTQELLTKTFRDNNIIFAKYPTKLLLQVPRSGKQFKSFKCCVPSLQLDITDLCKTSGACFICNQLGGYLCKDCWDEEFLEYKMDLYFCSNCWPLWHQKSHRKNHKHYVYDDFDTGTLHLLSVLCVETSHYVCFTRITGSGKDEWVFFDSMAERQDNGYNIPKVTHCTDVLREYVYGENKKDINRIISKDLPELVCRFVEDAYLCIYIDYEGVMYQ